MESNAELDGFLMEGLSLEIEVSRNNSEDFDIAHKINRECHSLIFDHMKVRNRDGQSMLVAALFLRALQRFQASILLFRKGLVASGKVAIRAELEATFAVRAIAADEGNLRAFVKDELRARWEIMKNARKYDYPIMKRVREGISDEDFSRLTEQVSSANLKDKLSTSTLSKWAELHELYVSTYSFLSQAAHSGVRELDAYFILGADGEVSEIEYAPKREEVTDLLLTACEFVLLGSDAVCRQFEIESFGHVRREFAAAMAGMKTLKKVVPNRKTTPWNNYGRPLRAGS
jgi:hypothetical protein